MFSQICWGACVLMMPVWCQVLLVLELELVLVLVLPVAVAAVVQQNVPENAAGIPAGLAGVFAAAQLLLAAVMLAPVFVAALLSARQAAAVLPMRQLQLKQLCCCAELLAPRKRL